MCFGTTIVCEACKRPTIYLFPGVRRCTTRGLPTHTITGPTISAHSCWQCRNNSPVDEKAHHHAWHEQACFLLGYKDLWRESENKVELLEAEIDSCPDITIATKLSELKKKEEERAKSLAIAVIDLDKWREHPTSPITVISSPSKDELKALTFKEWIKVDGLEDWEGIPGEMFERCFAAHDFGYDMYLEVNGFEYQRDQVRAQVEALQYAQRKEFDFMPEGELLCFRSWVKKERVGVLRDCEDADNEQEKFEHSLKLYGSYLKESAPEGNSMVFDEFRASITRVLRRQHKELTHIVFDDGSSELTTSESPFGDEHEITAAPMTFAEWSASPLAHRTTQMSKNTSEALRIDCRDYIAYLRTFPLEHESHEAFRYTRRKLDIARFFHFDYKPPGLPTLHAERLSFKAFHRNLSNQGYHRVDYEWALDAYALYLGSFADHAAVVSFELVRDWYARDDRRELCGFLREDPFVVRIVSVLKRLAHLINEAEEYGAECKAEVQSCLEDVILRLDDCLDTHTEPTTGLWEQIRAAYHQAEPVYLAAVEERRRFVERFNMVAGHVLHFIEQGVNFMRPFTFDAPIISRLPPGPDRDSDDEWSSDEEDDNPFVNLSRALDAVLEEEHRNNGH